MFARKTLRPSKILTVALQLALVCWLMIALEVEDTLNIAKIIPLIAAGSVLQFFVPDTYRNHFFVLLGILGIFALLGVLEAFVFFAIFGCFFLLSQLPISVGKRSILLLFAGGVLAYLWIFHAKIIPGSWVTVPILGSVFMFRLSLYLYDSRFEKELPPLSKRLAYFLMLPNLVFTLFPVIDYKTFKQSDDFSKQLRVQQKGVHLMIRGFVHLMLYRLLYYYLLPNPTQISSLSELAMYALCSYLMILRLSGLFHFAVGVLCLFGFDLPRVFNNYFLASGFSDLWRRINTYWRDYIMKVFYYPIYFKVKKLGQLKGMVITILIVFFLTWLLHSYQWFWLKGSFPIRMVDAIFWGIFGVMVSASAAQQYYKKKKKLKPTLRSPLAGSFLTVLQITAMFSFMCVLWTFWNSPSVSDWWKLTGVAREASLADWWGVISILLAVIAIGTLLYYCLNRPAAQKIVNPKPGSMQGAAYGLLSLLPFVVMYLRPELLNNLDPYFNQPSSHYLENRLNEQDDELMVKGYYEDILLSNHMSNNMSSQLRVKPKNFIPFNESDVVRHRDDWLKRDFMPNSSGLLKDFEVNINSWGMRDQEYQLPKPIGTIRIGVFGGSYVAGSGIADEDIFNQVVNREFIKAPFRDYQIEMLNFGVPGYHILENSYYFNQMGMDKELDVAIFVVHSTEFNTIYKHTLDASKDPNFIPTIAQLLDSLLINDKENTVLDRKEIRRRGKEIVMASYRYLASQFQQTNIVPIVIHWPRTVKDVNAGQLDFLKNQARMHGFSFINLSTIYDGVSIEDIIVSNYDKHPNNLGHELVGKAIAEKIRTLPAMIELANQLDEQQ